VSLKIADAAANTWRAVSPIPIAAATSSASPRRMSVRAFGAPGRGTRRRKGEGTLRRKGDGPAALSRVSQPGQRLAKGPWSAFGFLLPKGRDSKEVLTHNGTSPPSIDALRKFHPINS
jgi:hypothetical protein